MLVVGLSHQTAPIEVRERVAISPGQLAATLTRLNSLEQVAETVLLSTCNRVEVYAVAVPGSSDSDVVDAIISVLAELGGREVVPHLTQRCDSDALRHLFRVASSLDSLVVGEPQILGQLKDAVHAAGEAGTLGPQLHLAIRSALQVAKRVRTDTAIGQGQLSVPSVAVDLASQIFEELNRQTALLVGAGEMAEAAAKLLARAGTRVVVVNRSPERAEKLATAVGGTPFPWADLTDLLIDADIVITSTASPHHVITKKQLRGIRRKRRGRSLFLIDIAVPRDVDPKVNDIDNVYLYDIDDLSHVVAQSVEGRKAEAERAEALVLKEIDAFDQRRSQQRMKPIIVAMRERTRELLSAELNRSYKGRLKHLADGDRSALGVMVEAAVNKLLHTPSMHLKQLATTERSSEVAQLMCRLFDLDERLDEASKDDAPEIEFAEVPSHEAERLEGAPHDAQQLDDDEASDAPEVPRVAAR